MSRRGRYNYACWQHLDQKLDYACRYTRGPRCECYCCGSMLSFVEHGTVCSRFCQLGSDKKEQQGFGLAPIISLPNRWNEHPELAALTVEDERAERARFCGVVVSDDYESYAPSGRNPYGGNRRGSSNADGQTNALPEEAENKDTEDKKTTSSQAGSATDNTDESNIIPDNVASETAATATSTFRTSTTITPTVKIKLPSPPARPTTIRFFSNPDEPRRDQLDAWGNIITDDTSQRPTRSSTPAGTEPSAEMTPDPGPILDEAEGPQQQTSPKTVAKEGAISFS